MQRHWWYPCFGSKTMKMRLFCCFCRMMSTFGNNYESCWVQCFNLM